MAKVDYISFAICAAFFLVIIPNISLAETIYVSPGYDIQTIIETANPGDTIIFKDGTYNLSEFGGIEITKSLHLKSENGPEKTVLLKDGEGYAIKIDGIAENVTIEGFTIKGGKIKNITAIQIFQPSAESVNVTIKNCKIDRVTKGIVLNGTNNVKISNISISDSDFGIIVKYSNNVIFENFKVIQPIYGGITIENSTNIKIDCNGNINLGDGNQIFSKITNSVNINIKNCIVNNWKYGIYLDHSNNNSISHITATSNEYGIYLENSDYNILSHIIAKDHGRDGIDLDSSDFNTFSHITANNNGNNGIYTSNSDYNIFLNTTANNNSRVNIALCSSNYNIFSNVTATLGSTTSIHLSSSSYNYFSNVVVTSSNVGISCFSANYNTFSYVTVTSSNVGFWLADFDSNTINNSHICGNFRGIYVYSAGKNGPNLIYNNIFNNTNNVYFGFVYQNYWNTTKRPGKNIWNESLGYIGGNFWTTPNGNGYSDICNDRNGDGFCDSPYILASNNIDFLPLSRNINQNKTECLCTDWEDTGCVNSTHKRYVRTCNPRYCDIEEKFEYDESCANINKKQPPVALFTYFPHSPKIGDTITFNASSSYDPDGGLIVSYEWDFGDNTSEEGIEITHKYNKCGRFIVTLTVTDNDSLSSSISKEIIVSCEEKNRSINWEEVINITQNFVEAYQFYRNYALNPSWYDELGNKKSDEALNSITEKLDLIHMIQENLISSLVRIFNEVLPSVLEAHSVYDAIEILQKSKQVAVYHDIFQLLFKANEIENYQLAFDNLISKSQNLISVAKSKDVSRFNSSLEEIKVNIEESAKKLKATDETIFAKINYHCGFGFPHICGDYLLHFPGSKGDYYIQLKLGIYEVLNYLDLHYKYVTYLLYNYSESLLDKIYLEDSDICKISDSTFCDWLPEGIFGSKKYIMYILGYVPGNDLINEKLHTIDLDPSEGKTVEISLSSEKNTSMWAIIKYGSEPEFKEGKYDYFLWSNNKLKLRNFKKGKYFIKILTTKDKGSIYTLSILQYRNIFDNFELWSSGEEKEILEFHCPVNITIKDKFGRVASDNGKLEIPGTSVTLLDDEKIFILPANLSYFVNITSYGNGTLSIFRIRKDNKNIIMNKITGILVNTTTGAYFAIDPNRENLNLSIDYDKDGKIEENRTLETKKYSLLKLKIQSYGVKFKPMLQVRIFRGEYPIVDLKGKEFHVEIISNYTYNISFSDTNHSVSLFFKDINITSSDNFSLSLDRFSPTRKSFIYAIEFNTSKLNSFNITVKLNYTTLNPDHIKLYTCHNWDFENRKCNGVWEEIPSFRIEGNYVVFNVSHFSAFKIEEEPYCGDGICNNGETCSSCPQDCGPCPEPSRGGSGGSGGGGSGFGGSIASFSQTCIENWTCTEWSECYPNGTQYRKCIDLNNCGTTKNKPIEVRSCTYECEEKWVCTEWSECYPNGTQYRKCVDVNHCNTTYNKPPEVRECNYTSETVPVNVTGEKQITGLVVGEEVKNILVSFCLIVAGVGGYIIYRWKKGKR